MRSLKRSCLSNRLNWSSSTRAKMQTHQTWKVTLVELAWCIRATLSKAQVRCFSSPTSARMYFTPNGKWIQLLSKMVDAQKKIHRSKKHQHLKKIEAIKTWYLLILLSNSYLWKTLMTTAMVTKQNRKGCTVLPERLVQSATKDKDR